MLYDTVEEMLHIFLTSALGGKGIFTRGKTILVLPWNKALPCITPNMGLVEFRTPDIQTVASHFTAQSSYYLGIKHCPALHQIWA